MTLRNARAEDRAEWLRMRVALWPDAAEDSPGEIDAILADPITAALTWVAERADGRLGGLLEASLRSHAEGCTDAPVPYLEGWWVDADLRRTGVGGALVAALEAWARDHGFDELASDTELDNVVSQAAHAALGFEEIDRAVLLRKALR